MGHPPHEQAVDRWVCDVLIVGAGPAGSAAAIEAARAGADVVVIDKARFPRDKCCGDGLTTGALRHLDELGLDPTSLPSWMTVSDVHIVSPFGRQRVFPLPDDGGQFAAVCRRSELDAAMVDLARQHGANVLEGHELRSIEQDAAGVTAAVDGIVFRAPYVLAADGMWSPTRTLLGLKEDGYRGEWHAFRQYFSGVTGAAAEDLIVWFEPDLLPGYAWSFPVAGGVANVGFGLQRGNRYAVGDMRRLWPELLSRPHIAAALGPDATPEAPHRAWPIPARLGDAPLTAGRVLFVGDAATATDPMTGEGIGQAYETGRSAVRAITTAGPHRPDDATALYRRELGSTVVRDHRLAGSLSAILRSRRLAEAAIATAAATGWTRRNFGRWLFEDYPRAVALTPRRWGQVRRRSGAFVAEAAGRPQRGRITTSRSPG